MKSTKTLTTNTSVLLCSAHRNKETNMYEATIFAYGSGGSNFDGGTVTIQASPDQGTTKVTLKDIAGTVVSITANDVYNVKLGGGNRNQDFIELYATMIGATTPNVTVDVFDNAA